MNPPRSPETEIPCAVPNKPPRHRMLHANEDWHRPAVADSRPRATTKTDLRCRRPYAERKRASPEGASRVADPIQPDSPVWLGLLSRARPGVLQLRASTE